MKHGDNDRAEIWAVCGLDAAGWAGAKQGFELCQFLLKMERHMIKKQEDEVWKFWVHRGLLVQQTPASKAMHIPKLWHIPSGAGGL